MQIPVYISKIEFVQVAPFHQPSVNLAPSDGDTSMMIQTRPLQATHRLWSPTKTFGGLQGTAALEMPGESREGNNDLNSYK